MSNRSVRLAVLTALMAAGVLAPAATAAPVPALTGGAPATAKVCGADHAVRQIAPGAALAVTVKAARLSRVRAARAGSTVVIERCANGAWTAVRSVSLGPRTTTLTAALAPEARSAADLRVRVRMRSKHLGRAAYARVGVGEIVDVPVSFDVVNQNRTSIPCLGGPDGKTYTVHGSLVAPRAVLEQPKPAITLYLHGLGYSSFFFRFQDVPGYDYGLRQAQAGHASVVLDRLGNPSHDDLPDGNATCLPAQADMADQVIGQLRAGTGDTSGAAPAFGHVLLAGHSAGGLITQVTQYSFKSADAIAVISYTDVPSPLTLSTFTAAGSDCVTAPQHAHGTTGAPNYAPFGRTDADFAAGHFHDIDPVVEKAVLAKHNRDPCGDLLSALGALATDQVMTRSITVPVLVISGTNDALFSPPTNQLQASTAYPASSDVALTELADTGHAVTLGRTHEAFRAAMDKWLTAHGG